MASEFEASHEAMLFFMEVLMNSTDPLTISQIAGRFGAKNFTPEMRQAAGSNEEGLKKFLLKYPSLFKVSSNMVSINNDLGLSAPVTTSPKRHQRSHSFGGGDGEKKLRNLPDVSIEMDAVKFFQDRLERREEKWVLIKSLAGHLSQATNDVRYCVGPQTEFKRFLLKHPHIFEVEHEMVSLREHPFESPKSTPRELPTFNSNGDVRKRAKPYGGSKSASRPKSEGFYDSSSPSGAKSSSKPVPLSMSANEYKAVMFIKDIVEKSQRGAVKVLNITSHFTLAPECVRNTVGWTKYELEEFVKQYPTVFTVDDNGDLTVNKSGRLHVIITGSRPSLQGVQTLTGRKGAIYHVAKLWGIVDLGKHEHVFFDKSIMPKEYEDLQKHFKIGEILWFNAVLAPKKSRAKWRATKVWKDTETEDSVAMSRQNSEEASVDYESEVQQVLSQSDTDLETQGYRSLSSSDLMADMNYPYGDAAPSGAGVIPVWSFRSVSASSKEETESGDDGSSHSGQSRDLDLSPIATLSMMPESHFMQSSAVGDCRVRPGYMLVPVSKSKDSTNTQSVTHAHEQETNSNRKLVSVACQTISTGDIMATQLYDE